MTRPNQWYWITGLARKQTRRRKVLKVEHLEDRATPAAVAWDGGGGSLNWFDSLNWDTDTLPTINDDVTISGAAGAVEINDALGIATAGTLTSSSGLSVIAGTLQLAGNSLITGAFTNSGSVSVTGGNLTVGTGSSSGSIQLAGGANMIVAASFAQPFVLLDGATVTGGAIVINNHLQIGGTVAVDEIRITNASAELNALAGGQLTVKTLDNFGIINGAGTVIVTDRWFFRGSFLRGTGVLINQGLATFGFAQTTIIERTVENFGTAIVDLPGLRVSFNGPGSWINRPGSVFEMRANTSLLSFNPIPTAGFFNQGTLLKTGTNPASSNATIQLPLVNEAGGTVQVTQGALILTGGGSSAGTFDLLSGTTLQVTGNYTLEAGATTIGPGEFKITGNGSNIVFVAGAASVANLRLENSAWLSLGAPLTVGNLTQTSFGSLFGPGDVTVNGVLAWSSGTMFGPGKTILNGTAAINIPPGTFQHSMLDSRTVDNAGSVTLTTNSVNSFQFAGTATWNNLPGSVFQMSGGVSSSSAPAAVFNNAGTLRKTAASTGTFSVRLVNSGLVEVLAGDLATGPNSRNSGIVDIATANGRWILGTGGSTFLDEGSTITGPGRVYVQLSTNIQPSPNLTVTAAMTIPRLQQDGGTTTVNAPLTISNYIFNGGTTTANAPLTIGDFTFSGGVLTGPAKTTLTGSSSFSGGISNHTVDNAGTVVSQGMGMTNAVFNNLAGALFSFSTFSINGSVGSSAFNNSGTLRRTASSGSVTFGVRIINTGRLEILAGDLITAGNTRSSGVVDIAAPARWVLNNSSSNVPTFLDEGATVTGPGLIVIQSGSLTVSAATSIPRLQQNFGTGGPTLNMNAPVTIGDYTFNAGTLTGTGKTTLTGSSSFIGGNPKTILNHTVDNAGTISRSVAGNLQLTNAVFNNLPGALFDIAGNGTTIVTGTSPFNNAGTVRRSSGGLTNWSAPLNNSGNFEINSGDFRIIAPAGLPAGVPMVVNTGVIHVGVTTAAPSIILPPGFTLTGGTLTGIARVRFSIAGSTLTIDPAATLGGALSVQANLINRGTVRPDSTAVPLNVTGNYTQVDDATADGRLVIGLRGDSGSGLFGKLLVNGQSNLAGPLEVFADGAFLPDFGDVFEVYRSIGARTGDFTYPVGGYDLDGYRILDPEYDVTGLRLRLETEVGDLPVIDPIADVTVNEGQTVQFTATVAGAEPPGPLTFSLAAGSSPGATINPTTGEFIFFAPAGPAEYVFQVNVHDPNAPTDPVDIETFKVTVLNVAPTVSITGGQSQLNEGEQFTAAGSFTDPGADTWTATIDYGDGTGVSALTLNPDKTFALDHHYLDNGNFTVTVRVFDGFEHGEATFDVAVANLDPTVIAADDQAAEESASQTFNLGTFSDFGLSDAPWTVEVNWGDGSAPLTFDTLEQGLLGSAAHTYADSGTYTVTVRVTDKDGGVGSDTFLVTVGNLAPVASVTGPASGVRGQVRTFTLSATDPSLIDQAAGFTFSVDWGDGSSQEVTGLSGVTVEHIFVDSSTYTVTVTATDKNGGASASATHTIAIVVAEVQGGVLAIGGTTGADSIQVKKGAGDGASLEVTVNGANLGEFGGLTRAVVYGQAGDDDLDATGSTDLSLALHGGVGNDRLKGGAKDDILDGAAGDDELLGGLGRDILIGGAGSDRAVSQSGDDILIGGQFMGNELTEARSAALLTVASGWSSAASYPERVAALTAYLTARVSDDGVADHLTGSAGNDWYFARTSGPAGELDVLSGVSSGDTVTPI